MNVNTVLAFGLGGLVAWCLVRRAERAHVDGLRRLARRAQAQELVAASSGELRGPAYAADEGC